MQIRFRNIGACLVCAWLIGSCGHATKSANTTGGVTTTQEEVPPPSPHPVSSTVHIHVVYPPMGSMRPSVDSNFIFGTVGSRSANLTINGVIVPVASNGAFLAFLPQPFDGYRIVAVVGSQRDSVFIPFGTKEVGSLSDVGGPAPSSTSAKPTVRTAPEVTTFARPIAGVVTRARDTLATGSDAAAVSPTIGADRKWQLPNQSRVEVTGKEGNQLRIRLGQSAQGWIADTNVLLDSNAHSASKNIGVASVNAGGIRIPANYPPFAVEITGHTVRVSIYDRAIVNTTYRKLGDSAAFMVKSAGWKTNGTDEAEFTAEYSQTPWGYKAYYDNDGSLVVLVRKPPVIDPNHPVKGLTIVVDPGHPPAGAIGPTELTEADANLAIGLRIADKLRALGANVLMTRTTPEPMVSATSQLIELGARINYAVEKNADILLSVHNNAFPPGVNPFLNYGSTTYYFNASASDLAYMLDQEIIAVTKIPNLGARQRSLALVRPTWMPSVLTESLFMMFPDQEMELRDSNFLNDLADAHVRGIENFLKARSLNP